MIDHVLRLQLRHQRIGFGHEINHRRDAGCIDMRLGRPAWLFFPTFAAWRPFDVAQDMLCVRYSETDRCAKRTYENWPTGL
jgi:hypothetical protein